ncbi:MAG: hypothetical protein ACHQU0_00740 [Candidatus Paceibacteria bacterium]
MVDIYISKIEVGKKIRSLAASDKNICFIFGAGASYGYSHISPYKPPVVASLFDIFNPVVDEIISQEKHKSIRANREHHANIIRDFYGNDLESYLSALYKNNGNDNLFANLLVYLHDIFSLASTHFEPEDNYYKELINFIYSLFREDRWSCLSFNYDTLLEKSYVETDRDSSGRTFNDFDSYAKLQPNILKIHGGINFYHNYRKLFEFEDISRFPSRFTMFSEMMKDNNSIERFLSVSSPFSNGIKPHVEEYLYDPSSGTNKNFSSYRGPLMLIPIHAEIELGNLYFQKMIELSKEKINDADLVIAIGYNFGDKTFTDSLDKIELSGKELILVDIKKVVSDPSNYIGYQRAKKIWGSGKVKIFNGDGFGEFIESLLTKTDETKSSVTVTDFLP